MTGTAINSTKNRLYKLQPTHTFSAANTRDENTNIHTHSVTIVCARDLARANNGDHAPKQQHELRADRNARKNRLLVVLHTQSKTAHNTHAPTHTRRSCRAVDRGQPQSTCATIRPPHMNTSRADHFGSRRSSRHPNSGENGFDSKEAQHDGPQSSVGQRSRALHSTKQSVRPENTNELTKLLSKMRSSRNLQCANRMKTRESGGYAHFDEYWQKNGIEAKL